MTEYAKLVLAEQTCHTIEIREKATGKEARKARKAKKDKEAEGQVDEMQAAREAYENELKEILTEDQFNKWQKQQEEMRAQFGGGGF